MDRRQFVGAAGLSVLGVVGGTTSVALAAPFTGYKTNKFDLKKKTEEGGWVIAWADDISETDVGAGVVAAGVSVLAANPAPFLAWAEQLVERTITSIVDNAKEKFPDEIRKQAVKMFMDVVKQAVQGKDAREVLKQYDTVDFKAGAIKYSGANYALGKVVSRTWGLKPYTGFRWRGTAGKAATLNGLAHEREVAFRTRRGVFLNCYDSLGEVKARTGENREKAERDEIWTLHRKDGNGLVRSGDFVAFRTYRGIYINCWDSEGEVKARTGDNKHLAERDEFWRIWKADGPVSEGGHTVFKKKTDDIIVSGDRVFFETGKGVMINCFDSQGKVAARTGENRTLAQDDEVFTVFLASQLPDEAKLKLDD